MTTPQRPARNGSLSDRWWATYGVAVGLIVAWMAFNAILFGLADDGDNESVWGRYIFLLAGIEGAVFVVIGWLFGVQATRVAVNQAQKNADAAAQAVGEAKAETAQAKGEAQDNARDAERGRSLAVAVESAELPATVEQADGSLGSQSTDTPSAQLASLQRMARQLFPDI